MPLSQRRDHASRSGQLRHGAAAPDVDRRRMTMTATHIRGVLPRWRPALAMLATLALALALGACRAPAPTGPDTAGDATAKTPFKVVTTFTVIADIARNVAGDAAVVESITKPDAEIHNYQPTPGDLARAQG